MGFRQANAVYGRIFCSPSRHVDELEGVILEQGLLVAQDLNVFVVVGGVQQLFSNKLFQMCDSGQ